MRFEVSARASASWRAVGVSFGIAIALWVLARPLPADEILLQDGSLVVGQVKRLKGARLNVRTAHMGTVRIQRRNVVELRTEKALTVELDSGQRLTGKLSIEGDLLRIEGEETHLVARIAVVGIDRAELTPWDRLDLDASGGFNVVRGNDRTTSLRADARAAYNYESDARTAFEISTTLNEQKDGNDTRRTTLNLGHEHRQLWKRLGLGVGARLERNEATQLDLRTIVSGTVGWRIVKTPRNDLELYGGMSWLSEDFEDEDLQNQFDATFGLDYRLRFDRTRFDGLLVIIPSGEDRTLVQLDGKVRIELIKSIDFDVTFYERYDSAPPVATDRHDYGFTLGLGWTK